MTTKGQSMNSLLMSDLHQSPVRSEPLSHPIQKPWLWRLARHAATTLAAAPEPRWLLVNTGMVWVTQVSTVTAGDLPPDIWLATGQSLRLPPGSSWVVEAWEPAEVSLAVRGAARRPRAFTRGWRGWFSSPPPLS
jgi:hypothetical protein